MSRQNLFFSIPFLSAVFPPSPPQSPPLSCSPTKLQLPVVRRRHSATLSVFHNDLSEILASGTSQGDVCQQLDSVIRDIQLECDTTLPNIRFVLRLLKTAAEPGSSRPATVQYVHSVQRFLKQQRAYALAPKPEMVLFHEELMALGDAFQNPLVGSGYRTRMIALMFEDPRWQEVLQCRVAVDRRIGDALCEVGRFLQRGQLVLATLSLDELLDMVRRLYTPTRV